MLSLCGSRVPGGRANAAALLAQAVGLVYGAPMPVIARAPGGKPYFPDEPDWHFSLSHSGSLALCALSDAPVGVDIELVRPRLAGLPRRVLSDEEYAAWKAAGATWAEFYVNWTRKEAACKYTGMGLRGDLRAIAVPEGVFYRGYAGETWCAAVCAEHAPPDEIIWLDEPAFDEGGIL